MVIVNAEENAIAVFDNSTGIERYSMTKEELLNKKSWGPMLKILREGEESVGGFKLEYQTKFFTVISDGSELAKTKLNPEYTGT